jgi:hypothetical protein
MIYPKLYSNSLLVSLNSRAVLSDETVGVVITDTNDARSLRLASINSQDDGMVRAHSCLENQVYNRGNRRLPQRGIPSCWNVVPKKATVQARSVTERLSLGEVPSFKLLSACRLKPLVAQKSVRHWQYVCARNVKSVIKAKCRACNESDLDNINRSRFSLVHPAAVSISASIPLVSCHHRSRTGHSQLLPCTCTNRHQNRHTF